MATPVAGDGPMLVTDSVQVNALPTVARPGAAICPRLRSAIGSMVVNLRLQPPAIIPVPPCDWSAITKRDQTPLASVSLKTDKLAGYGPLGAGAGKASASEVKSVGLNIPETIWLASGSAEAALSSKVKVRLEMGRLPPASDISSAFWPCGPTSKISRSSGKG